ncbi:MAG: DUF4330 domain-containing protein [Clostridia bacterium]|nr:DUF4330 domain-containing protein [Clostridia bacterium]
MALKRKKKAFNVSDLFFIVVIVAVIAVGIFLYKNMGIGSSDSSGSNTVTIEYTLEFKELNGAVIGHVKAGDNAQDPDNKQSIGTIVSVQTVPYEEIVYNAEDGNVYMQANPDSWNLLITIRAQAEHTDRGYYVNGTRFLVGKSNYLWSRGFAGKGYCINIREIG